MSKFEYLIGKYKQAGVSQDNIEYTIGCLADGTKREHILESLTADYRKMEYNQANAMLEDFFRANGGEFKVENKKGYLYGTFLLVLIGLPCTFYICYVFYYGGLLVKPVLVFAGAIFGILGGLGSIVMAMRGKYRDTHSPFDD